MVMSGLSLGTYVPISWSVALTNCVRSITFNAQKVTGSRDLVTPLFRKMFKDHVEALLGNILVKFQVI